MPDQIRKAVTILRPYLAGTEWRGRLDRLIGAYATGHLFSVERASRGLFRTTKRHREHGKKLLAAITDELVKRDLPEAWQAGAKSAEPILRGMVGRTGKLETLADVGRAMQLTGAVAKNARRDLAAIRHAFAAELKASGKMLSGEVEAAFAAGMRGHQTRRQLADDLLASEQAARKQLSKAYREVRSTGQALQQAERTGTDAEIKEARKAYQAANRKPGQVKTLLARFETRVQGHARDAIRQAAQASQTARFREMKFKVATWTAVNGSGSCPSCDHLHGTTKPFDDWWGNGPGDGGTLCGASCMCILVPEEYAATRQGLDKPVRMDGGGGRKPAEPKPELEPIKLGGKLAAQAREAGKRAKASKAFVPAKTVAEAEARIESLLKHQPMQHPAMRFHDSRGRHIGKADLSGLDLERANELTRLLESAAAEADKLGIPRIRGVTLPAQPIASGTMGDGFLGIKASRPREVFLAKDVRSIVAPDPIAKRLHAKQMVDRFARLAKSEKDVFAKHDWNVLRKHWEEELARRNSSDALSQVYEGEVSKWAWGQEKALRPEHAHQFFPNGRDKFRSTVWHEFGHHAAEHQPPAWRIKLVETHSKVHSASLGKRPGTDIARAATQYGDTNTDEWFAENFTLWKMGRKDLVHSAAKELIESMYGGG